MPSWLFSAKKWVSKRQTQYTDGAAAIARYLDGVKNGKKELSDFESAFESVDEHIENQARNTRNDEIALAGYGDQLSLTAEGLQETGIKAMFATLKTKLFAAASKAAQLALNALVSVGI